MYVVTLKIDLIKTFTVRVFPKLYEPGLTGFEAWIQKEVHMDSKILLPFPNVPQTLSARESSIVIGNST